MSFNINDLVIEHVVKVEHPWDNGYCNNCKFCKDEMCTSPLVNIKCEYIAVCQNIIEKEEN